MAAIGEIRDTVHKYITFSDLEKSVMDAPHVQRLRRIRQLSLAELTYPGADYSRFPHSLGVMHLAGKMARVLRSASAIEAGDEQRVRVAALLHDVGHGPFSHMYEDLISTKRAMTHEDLTKWVVAESSIADVLSANGYTPGEISELAVGKSGSSNPLLNQIISGYFDADVMDFLVRDSLHTGVEYGYVDISRLIDSLIPIDKTLSIDSAALYALESFYFARHMMFKAVYFHKTVRAAGVMVAKAMKLADEAIGLTSFKSTEEYLSIDDYYVVQSIAQSKERSEAMRKAKDLMERLRTRSLFKTSFEAFMYHDDKTMSGLVSNPRFKESVEKEIAKLAEVDEDFVVLDLSTVPSLPYRPAHEEAGGMVIPVAFKEGTEYTVRSLYDVSQVAKGLRGFVDIVRVYTIPEARESVAKAAREVFGEPPTSLKISF